MAKRRKKRKLRVGRILITLLILFILLFGGYELAIMPFNNIYVSISINIFLNT